VDAFGYVDGQSSVRSCLFSSSPKT
jgi:hypothetical protein